MLQKYKRRSHCQHGGLIPGPAAWADEQPGEHPAVMKPHANSSWIYIRRQTGRSPPPHSTLSFSHSLSLCPNHPCVHKLTGADPPADQFPQHVGGSLVLRASHIFSSSLVDQRGRRGRKKYWLRPLSTPRQHVLQRDLLFRPVVETPAGPGWWKTNRGDEERCWRRGGRGGGTNDKRGEGSGSGGWSHRRRRAFVSS